MEGVDFPQVLHNVKNIKNKLLLSVNYNDNYTMVETDIYNTIFYTTGAASKTFTILDPTTNKDRQLKILKIDNAAGNLIVSGAINGTIKFTIFEQYTGIEIKSNGLEWVIVRIIGKIKQSILDANYRLITPAILSTWYQPAGAALQLNLEPGIYKLNYYIFFGVLLITSVGVITGKHQLGTSGTAGNLLIGNPTMCNTENWYSGNSYVGGGLWGREEYYTTNSDVTIRVNSMALLWAGTPTLSNIAYRGDQTPQELIAERIG